MQLDEFTKFEREYAKKGLVIAGADEAGRGPLAGPVVAAAVVMPVDEWIEGVNDSKKIAEKKRERLYEEITSRAVSFGVGIVDVEEIERINILEAARKAFEIALEGLSVQPAHIFTDAMKIHSSVPYTPLIKGDATVYSIAAASIIAKVTRDRIMLEYDKIYPEYGFAKHKGYGTKAHREAILANGPCEIHRMSFLRKLLSL